MVHPEKKLLIGSSFCDSRPEDDSLKTGHKEQEDDGHLWHNNLWSGKRRNCRCPGHLPNILNGFFIGCERVKPGGKFVSEGTTRTSPWRTWSPPPACPAPRRAARKSTGDTKISSICASCRVAYGARCLLICKNGKSDLSLMLLSLCLFVPRTVAETLLSPQCHSTPSIKETQMKLDFLT